MTAYKNKITNLNQTLKKLRKSKRNVAFLRAGVFILIFFLVYKYVESNSTIYILSFSTFTIFFFILIKYDFSLKDRIKFSENLLSINEKELEFLEGNISHFDEGQEFVNHSHKYSYDLDIFGEGSIFHFFNRTVTFEGKQCLKNKFYEINKIKSQIDNRQKAIDELSEKLDFRQNFTATGMQSGEYKSDSKNTENLMNDVFEWLKGKNIFYKKAFWKYFLVLSPAFSLSLLLLAIFGTVHFNVFILYGFLQLGIAGLFFKKINKEHSQLTKKHEKLRILEKLIFLFEKENFSSDFLIELKKSITYENKPASALLTRFNNNLRAFDSRLNFLIAILFNMSLLWDLQVMYRLEKTKEILNETLLKWLELIGEIDALNSLANYNYNNSDYVLPEIVEGDFILEALDTGHPLINKSNRVNNDFSITGLKKISIITGANMAGKSTFLRTIGVNMILASAGVRICAQKFVVRPIDIFTSVRTFDSLQKNESYFFSELMRLKKIIDILKSGGELFVILDEMLKGTNSKDKHKGSEELICRLINYKTAGLVATHDIGLGELKEKFPENIDTKKFEIEIYNTELTFDYKLKDGVSKNLNATYLMKKYGIIDE